MSNETHTLTVESIPHLCGGHLCGGHQVKVFCSCGYEGQEARIGHGCADSDPLNERLDATHAAALARWQAARETPAPRQHAY